MLAPIFRFPLWRVVAVFLAATIGVTSATAQTSSGIASPPTYHIVNQFPVGGDGSWDYLAFDVVGHRLFIAHQTRITVVDPATGHVVGEIAGLHRAHGVAFDYSTGHGFATSGEDGTVTMFDLNTLAVLHTSPAGVDADAVLYDSVSHHVFTFNGDASSAAVINTITGVRIATIPLAGKPEFGVSAGDGKIYVNIEDKSEVVEIDATTLKTTRRWPLAPCESPSGLAIDRVGHRLFSGCANKVMAISDYVAGKLVTTVPIGSGVDANAFDPVTQNAFSSNGEGSITVVHEITPDSFQVTQTVATMPGARTMTIDPSTQTLYTVSAKFEERPAQATPSNPRRRPAVVPGSFTLIALRQE